MPVRDTTILKTPAADEPALAEVVRRLVAAYQPERVYLFGSVARGDADLDSDYDLLPRESRWQVPFPIGGGQRHHDGQHDGSGATNHTISCAPVCDVS